MRKQLAFMLGRQQVFLDLEETECEDVEDIADIMSNVHLNNNFLALAREVKKKSGKSALNFIRVDDTCTCISWGGWMIHNVTVLSIFDILCSFSA